MALVRVRRRFKSALRQRIISVLTSNAANRIDFRLDGIHVVGSEVGQLLTGLILIPLGHSPIGIHSGNVMDGAEAGYNTGSNSFDFPHDYYGETAEERAGIFHECVHAWLDARVPTTPFPADLARRLLMRMTKLTEEAAAYVAESLYLAYDTTPTGCWPAPTDAADPVHIEADRIAAQIMDRPGAVVPAGCADALKDKIMAEPLYWDIKADPTSTYENDGV